MADKVVLTWFIDKQLSETGVVGTDVGQSYRLPWRARPVEVWMKARTAPKGREVLADINDDGVSIMSTAASLPSDLKESRSHNFVDGAVIEAGSVLTLDIDQVGSSISGEDLTVSLELELLS